MIGYTEGPKSVTQYKVVSSDHPGKLSFKVTESLHEGWKLQGGVSCMLLNRNYDKEYYQAMVRK